MIQRFEADEHAKLGDEGTRGEQGEIRSVELAPDYRITYGEMTAMAGDFFGGISEMRNLANNKSHQGVGTREEIEYVRICKVRAKNKEDEKAKEGAFSATVREAVDKRYYALALNNRAHFVNSATGDENVSTLEKTRRELQVAFPLQQGNLKDATSSYHLYHVQALAEAYEAGKSGKGVDQAMAAEAFGSHYLTDSFSSGHLRTPRFTIGEHWNDRVKMFNYNLKGYIAQKLAEKLVPWYTTKDFAYSSKTLKDGALVTVTKKIDAKGFIRFGDVVSGAVHDYDNEHGVRATVEGKETRLFGDAHLDANTATLAQKAVRAGMEDILKAWNAGKKKSDITSMAAELAPGGVFLPEQMIPQVMPDGKVDEKDKRVKWDYNNVFDLLADPKFKEALAIFANGKAKEFEEVAESLEPDQKKAFMDNVVKPLRADPVKVITEVINWVPSTGGGLFGHNEDDNAMDYIAIAKKDNALGTLTVDQKVQLIRQVFSGDTWDGDEEALMEMINAKPSDVPAIVSRVGWDRMKSELGDAFTKKYPQAVPAGN